MTYNLIAAAGIATLLDIASFVLFIAPGSFVRADGIHVLTRELNGLVADMTTPAAVAARLCALVLIAALAVAADHIHKPVITARVLRGVVAFGAALATVIGVIGTASNLGAIS